MTDAELKLRQALHRDPGDLCAIIDLGSLLLRQGDFSAGWMYREHVSKKYLPSQNGTAPWLWRGERLAGKTLLVYPDEGYGDIIQYFPLLQQVAGLGASVIFQVPQALLRLFEHNAGPNIRLLAWEAQSELKEGFGADYYCAINSLPGLLSLQAHALPLAVAYLAPLPSDVATWQRRLGKRDLPRIGVVWQGNKKHLRDHLRSIPLELIKGMLTPDFHFYSLQMGLPSAPAALEPMRDCTSHIQDYADTAACLQCMDAVVSVDTSVAHLASAIGIPTLILIDAEADWRWGAQGSTSPWYPAAHLIRQQRPGDWRGALADVMAALPGVTRR